MSKLPDKYDAKIIENKWRHDWQKNKIYQWKNDLPKNQTFVIDTPPPTVSGLLHMGHVFSYTQADFVARYSRMSGKDVFYPMGFDDNGLPTERLVEKIIGKKAGIYENENGRGSFVIKCRDLLHDGVDGGYTDILAREEVVDRRDCLNAGDAITERMTCFGFNRQAPELHGQ